MLPKSAQLNRWKHPGMTKVAKEIDFTGKLARKDLLRMIVKAEVVAVWAEYNDSVRHLLTRGRWSSPEEFTAFDELGRLAFEAYQDGGGNIHQLVSEDEKKKWTIADHRLRFMAEFVRFATTPGEIWGGMHITQEHFLLAVLLLKFLDFEMTTKSYKHVPKTRTAMTKALEDHGIVLKVPLPVKQPKASTLPSLANNDDNHGDNTEQPDNNEGGEDLEEVAEQGQTEVPSVERSPAAAPSGSGMQAAIVSGVLTVTASPDGTAEAPPAQASLPYRIKREHSPAVIDLTEDDDDNNNKRLKVEHKDFVSTGAGGGNKRQGASGSLEMEVWWPGKLSTSNIVSPSTVSPLEDSKIWWPGKLAKLI